MMDYLWLQQSFTYTGKNLHARIKRQYPQKPLQAFSLQIEVFFFVVNVDSTLFVENSLNEF
jgi:hypothetical protein